MLKIIYILFFLGSFSYAQNINILNAIASQQTGASLPPPIGGAIDLVNLKAFPSAQGLSADDVTGGSGGEIFYVTSLADTDSGSYNATDDVYEGTLRYALKHPSNGYIIFRVAGGINTTLNGHYFSSDGTGNKTIMGGTAPFPGVIIYGGQFRIQGVSEGNYIIRGLTFLGGDDLAAGQSDAFNFKAQPKLVFSDNTVGWGADEALSFNDTDDVIVQRNLAIEGHPNHNVGSIMDTDVSTNPVGRTLSAHDNAFIHINHRSPNLQGRDNDFIETINQFGYNFGGGRVFSHRLGMNLNMINHFYKQGPLGTADSRPFYWNAGTIDSPSADTPLMYVSGNVVEGRFDGTADQTTKWEHHITGGGFTDGDALPSSWFTGTQFPLGMDIVVKSVPDAYAYNIVGKNIGARYYTNSSGVRTKYIHPFIDDYFEDAINATDTAYEDNQSNFVLPSIPSSGTAYTDTDHDGMADAWETLHGLNVGTKDGESVKLNWTIDGANFTNTAGYTNMQMFDDYVHGGFLWIISQQ